MVDLAANLRHESHDSVELVCPVSHNLPGSSVCGTEVHLRTGLEELDDFVNDSSKGQELLLGLSRKGLHEKGLNVIAHFPLFCNRPRDH